jgi:predicted ATPase
VRHRLPSGTVTFLFTDIEGSTLLVRDLGDRYPEVLSEHHRVLRSAFAAHGGVEVDTQGDSFFAAFDRASDALAAAAGAQRGLKDSAVRVRMGLHTGEPQLTKEGYAGLDIVCGQRIAAAGHGGQILISQTTRDLMPAAEVRDLGEHRLKDFPEPVRIFQLGHEDFPPLRSLNQTNLSFQMTRLVGRGVELDEAARLLRDGIRLLTLVGAPGAGKTRLGLQLALDLAPDFEEGVFIVGLAPLVDASLVEETIAQTVGAQNGLVDHLRHRHALLVLDNFEHVTAAAPVVAELLREAPSVAVVVTSRAPLRLTGEHELHVAPLAEDDAVSLFVERARSVGRELGRDEAVAQICRRLDCLPLAIELAATWTKVLSPRSLLPRLEQRLPLLVAGRRDAPDRQQTLHATINWSYRLLNESERELFAKLSVFAGGCTLDAAEAVCEATLGRLGSLVDSSLLRQDNDRFSLLETIGEYALERLAERGDEETIRRRHAQFFLALATRVMEDADIGLIEETEWPGRLLDEQENFRAALEWSYDSAETDVLSQLTNRLYPYWELRGRTAEARLWLERAVETTPDGGLLHRQLLAQTGHVALKQGDLERAGKLFEDALELNRAACDKLGIGICTHELGGVAGARGNYAHGATLLEEAAVRFEELGNSRRWAAALHDHGLIALKQGDVVRARRLIEQELDILGSEPPGGLAAIGNAFADLGFVALVDEREADAGDALRKALAIFRDLGSPAQIGDCLMWMAALAQRRGEVDLGARLAAAADRLRGPLGLAIDFYARDLYETTLDTAQTRAKAWHDGRTMPLEQVVEEAMSTESGTW